MYLLKLVKLTFLWELLAVTAAFFLCSEMYVRLVVPVFNFGGLSYNPREDWFIELLLLLFTALLLLRKSSKPSNFYNWLFFCFLLIPAAVLSAEQGSSRPHLFLMFFALWLSVLFKSFFSMFGGNRDLCQEGNYKRLPYLSVIVFILSILFFVVVSVRGAFNLDFEKVYDVRFDISENMPLFLRYLMPLAAGTLIGYIGALVAHRKELWGISLVVAIGILFFGFSSHKAMLFNPLVAIACYFILKMQRPHLLMLWGLSIVSVTTFVLPEEGIKWLGSLFASRIFFLPSQINFTYFELFELNPYMFWADSKISFGLVTSKLPMPAMKYVGGIITGNYEINANTGWVANAYMNAGVVGIVIYAAIIGLILSLVDSWSHVYGKELVGAAFFIPANTLIMSADLLITLLTSGLFVLILIFLLTTLRIRLSKSRMFMEVRRCFAHN